MTMFVVYTILFCSVIYLSQEQSDSQNVTDRKFIYKTYKYDTVINLTVNETTEQILNFIEESDQYRGLPTRVHVSTNDSISEDYPLFITATQQKSVSSWEIPLVIPSGHATRMFNNMARTLCPHDAGPNITTENRPLIQISTSNPSNISVGIKLRRVRDFYVELHKEIPLNVTPSTPKYYYFSFDSNPWNATQHNEQAGYLPRFNYTIPKSVLLIIESDDDVCAVVSIQNNSCPVFDNEKDMAYQGYHLTMTTKGGITLTQSMFPVGFYIVFIVKQSDGECTGASEAESFVSDHRVKSFRFRVVPTVSYAEYAIAISVTLAFIAAVSVCTCFILCLPSCPRPQASNQAVESERGASTSAPADDEVPIIDKNKSDHKDRDSDDSEPELATSSSLPRSLTLAGLARARPIAHSRRSNRYFWSALTVAVVYALPVVQLLSTYQMMVFQTGNQDLCYYNFLCARPLGVLSDFNHVFSNVGYVVLGLVFMMQTRLRQRKDDRMENMGIPEHRGLFYSMGFALVMEGVLSACYHLCPNKMNFQFDSSFMYVIAVLCMVKLYQNRHPDVNASAHATFLILAVIMAVGLLGILYPSVYFWGAFTALHLFACFVLTLNIYYLGRLQLERRIVGRAWAALLERGRRALRPAYRARAVLLAVANVANWGLAAYGLYEHNKDFARHLLAILMGNTLLYTAFYVIMKLVHRERVSPPAIVYLVLAHIAWLVAILLFKSSKTKWSETPAMSRRHNAECLALEFYDTHDLWHYASAAAMFFSFNMLLTVDDELRDTPRHTIPVF